MDDGSAVDVQSITLVYQRSSDDWQYRDISRRDLFTVRSDVWWTVTINVCTYLDFKFVENICKIFCVQITMPKNFVTYESEIRIKWSSCSFKWTINEVSKLLLSSRGIMSENFSSESNDVFGLQLNEAFELHWIYLFLISRAFCRCCKFAWTTFWRTCQSMMLQPLTS